MGLLKRQKKGASELLGPNTVAYFCAEYAISDTLPIYSGGLGVLAGDIVQEAEALRLPFVAVGLFYRKGYFHQVLESGTQREEPQLINPAEVPLELVLGETGETLLIDIPIQERIIRAQVWRYGLGSNSLYLLDTDHWSNTPKDRQITDQLYGGDQAKRIQQELVLGIGGVRALRRLGITPKVYHMNEGHSAFLSLELAHSYLAEDKDVQKALAKARGQLVFTNHTLIAAGNDVFPHELLSYYLGKYAFDSGIGLETILKLGSSPEHPEDFSMTYLALRMSRTCNAVSKLHAVEADKVWPAFKFQAITNGVHLPAWVASEFQHHWKQLAPQWQEETSNPATWKAIRKISNHALWQSHLVLKDQLLDEVYARTGIRLDLEALTIVWARRFASYKRPDLLFSDLDRLKKILFNAEKPVQIIIAGKSHPADEQGKQIIAHIENLANYDLKHRAVFLDDYSISLAKFLVAGADVWLNTPILGQEASGTSGMKAAANGVVQCTVPDGWAAEVDWYGIGYSLRSDRAAEDLYNVLEKRIIPTFYKRNRQDLPEIWTSMMRESIGALSPRFSSQRMLEDYVEKMYLPIVKSN